MKNEQLLATNGRSFTGGRIMSIDFGTKNIGLATFYPGRDPFPLPWGTISNNQQTLQNLRGVINDEAIDALLLGMPYLTDGKTTDMTKKVQSFGKLLEKEFPDMLLFTQDETLSSFEAEERMKQDPRYNFKVDKSKVDSVAACILLEDFCRRHGLS